MRRWLSVLLVALTGLVMVADGLVPELGLGPVRRGLVDGAVILSAFALLAGVLNLLGWHLRRLRGGEGASGGSILLMLALLGTATVTIALPESGAPEWLYAHLYQPIQASLMALLAFYSVSAAYRTFALRTADAVLLMISAVLLLFLQLPFTAALLPVLGDIRQWLLAAPIAGIMRGVLIGSALGAVTVSLRVLLGRERPQVGE
ncbi:MAG: hypothetical protein ABFD20_03820 [Anaerolineales bacterium]